MSTVTLNDNTGIGIEVVNGGLIVSVAVRRVPVNIDIFDNVLKVNYQIVITLANGGERVYKQIITDYTGIDLTKCGDMASVDVKVKPDPAEILKKITAEQESLELANSEAVSLANTIFG